MQIFLVVLRAASLLALIFSVFEMYNVPFNDTWQYASKNGASVLEVDIAETTRQLHELLEK